MLKFFKSYEPYFNLIYLVLSVIVCLPLVGSSPISESQFSIIPWTDIPSFVLMIICAALVWLGAWISTQLFATRDFHSISSGMPGLVFLLYSATILMGSCRPWALAASVFILAGLHFQSTIFRQNDVRKQSFNASVCYGIASLFYFPLAILLVAQFVALSLSRTFVWREYVLSIIGFSLAWIWAFAIGWIMDGDTYQTLVLGHMSDDGISLTPAFSPWLVMFVWGAFSLLKSFARSTNLSRNTKSITLVLSSALILALILGVSVGTSLPIELLAVPMAFILPFTVLDSDSRIRSWLILLLLISGTVGGYVHSLVL